MSKKLVNVATLVAGLIIGSLIASCLPGGPLNKHDWLQDRFDSYATAQAMKQVEIPKATPNTEPLRDWGTRITLPPYNGPFMTVDFHDVMQEPVCFDLCLNHGELRRIACTRPHGKASSGG
jgi:hypothetical protein